MFNNLTQKKFPDNRFILLHIDTNPKHKKSIKQQSLIKHTLTDATQFHFSARACVY